MTIDPDAKRAWAYVLYRARPWDWLLCQCTAIETGSGWRAPKTLDEWLPDPDCPYCGGWGAVHAKHFPRLYGWRLIHARLPRGEQAVLCPRCMRSLPERFDDWLPDPTCRYCGGTGVILLREEPVTEYVWRPEQDD